MYYSHIPGGSLLLVTLVFAAVLFSMTAFYLQLSLYNILSNSITRYDEYRSTHPHEIRLSSKDENVFLKWKDDNTLLNIENFRFITNNSSLCQRNGNGFKEKILPILIHSGRYHFDERNAIRSTYGSIKQYKSWHIILIFLLGESSIKSSDIGLEKILAKEISTFGNIIIGSFVDIYANLPYKHLMGYKYILNHCFWADYVLKVDDYMFLDIFRIIDANSQSPKGGKQEEWICNIFSNTNPTRDPKSKYYVSKENYSGDVYPTYCSGWCYGITVDWIYKIYSVSHRVNCCIIDDVMITGQLREYAEKAYNETAILQYEFWEEVTTDTRVYENLCLKRDDNTQRHFGTVVYVPRGEYFRQDMSCLWNNTLENYM